MRPSPRFRVIVLSLAVALVTSAFVPPALAAPVAVSGNTVWSAGNGPAITLAGDATIDGSAIHPDARTVRFESIRRGTVSFRSGPHASATVHAPLPGAWVNLTDVDARNEALPVELNGTTAFTLDGRLDAFAYRDPTSFAYAGGADNAAVTVHSLDAGQSYRAVAAGSGTVLDRNRTDSTGEVTFAVPSTREPERTAVEIRKPRLDGGSDDEGRSGGERASDDQGASARDGAGAPDGASAGQGSGVGDGTSAGSGGSGGNTANTADGTSARGGANGGGTVTTGGDAGAGDTASGGLSANGTGTVISNSSSVNVPDDATARVDASTGRDVHIESAGSNSTLVVDVVDGVRTAVDHVTIGIARATRDETVRVSSNAGSRSGTAQFANQDATVFGYITVSHSIRDSDVGHASFRFGVATTKLDAAGVSPDAVTLVRNESRGWTELNTTFTGRTDGRYMFTASSPGLSVFAITGNSATDGVAETAEAAARVTRTSGPVVGVTRTVESTAAPPRRPTEPVRAAGRPEQVVASDPATPTDASTATAGSWNPPLSAVVVVGSVVLAGTALVVRRRRERDPGGPLSM